MPLIPNTIISDSSPEWQNFTPTLTGDSGDPSIGAGIQRGRYCRIGDLIIANAYIEFGSGATFGSGAWRISIPVTASLDFSNNTGVPFGMTYYVDEGTTRSYASMFFHGDRDKCYLLRDGSQAFVSSTSPWTWVAGDELGYFAMYQAA